MKISELNKDKIFQIKATVMFLLMDLFPDLQCVEARDILDKIENILCQKMVLARQEISSDEAIIKGKKIYDPCTGITTYGL